MKALEFFDVPKFEALVASFKASYSSFRENNPKVAGKDLRLEFVNILKKLYNKFSSFESFRNIYPTFEDFKSKISKHLNKKRGWYRPPPKNVTLFREVADEILDDFLEDAKIVSFGNYEKRPAKFSKEELAEDVFNRAICPYLSKINY